MKFDLIGRLRNMRLPDGKAGILYSIYEAVSNAQHAIQDRFGADAPAMGSIEVEVAADAEGYVTSIVVRDNGMGLNDANLDAFDTCDSRNKDSRGGKGVGRLVWLNLFDTITVKSTFVNARNARETIQFNFVPNQEISLANLTRRPAPRDDIGTEIIFANVRAGGNAAMRGMAIVRNLALHFFSYFIGGSMPKLTVAFDDRSPVELTEYVKRHVENPVTETLAVGAVDGCNLEILHLYVARNISRDLRNSILLVAHDRQVERIEIEQKFALGDLPDGTAYIAIVRGPFLDERVDQERTGFKLTPEQHDAIVGAVMERCENFLLSHIGKRRAVQKEVVAELLNEHPQLAVKVRDIDAYVRTLGPNMGDEDIGKTLFTLLYRDERRIAKDIKLLSEAGNVSQEVRDKALETLAKATEQANARLAEYVAKRRQILDLGKTLMRFGPDDPGHREYGRAIRDLKDAELRTRDAPT